MIRSLKGDNDAYRALLNEVRKSLHDYYRRRLLDSGAVDDLTQETLISLHRRRATYEPDRPFTPWLHAIARYKLIDHLRSRRRNQAFSLDETPEAFFATDQTAAHNDRSDVERLLAGIPEGQRALIRAVKLEGRSVEEVSAASGLSPSAVRVTIHRAIKALGRHIAGQEEQ